MAEPRRPVFPPGRNTRRPDHAQGGATAGQEGLARRADATYSSHVLPPLAFDQVRGSSPSRRRRGQSGATRYGVPDRRIGECHGPRSIRSVRASGLDPRPHGHQGSGGAIRGNDSRDPDRGAPGLRLDLALRSLPHLLQTGARNHVRMLDLDRRAGPRHQPHPARADGHVQRISEPGAAGEDGVDCGRSEPRPARLRDRGRLV